ncbi:MAG TPA: zinc-dependent metalloprotease [Blastocatellia bacterium]|nr:zinc-dependent metalloprotease [Blastocatellia bacterium]
MKRLIVICLAALLAGGAFNYLRPGAHAAHAYVGQGLKTQATNSATGDLAQDPPTGQDQQAGGRQGFGRGGQQSAEPQPYERVITKDAKTMVGVFTVHRIKDKLYYEIPRNELDKEFLWVSLIAKTTEGAGQGGQAAGNRVVRWERRDNKVYLRSIDYSIVATDPDAPIAKAVAAANNDTIIAAFNVEAIGKDDAPVIDVTRLFVTEVPEFSPRTRIGARGFDASRSFLERAVAYPENVEVEATQTFTSPPDTAQPFGGGRPTGPAGQQQGMRTGSATVLMHYSMVKLPEKPMMPRFFDSRVGYFTVNQLDYSRDEQKAPRNQLITRWRLEKKDPNAALSEPIKPIVYYVDPATPKKWVPAIKKAIECWQVAFEAAGFKNAIIAKDAPTPQEDPNWSPDDSRYSVVRWLPSTTENAVGPHISDPRTGEILNADIQLYHNVMNLARDWYFIQVSPLDPRAQKLPLPDDLMSDLITYVVAHEVGHTLGFQHNMKASSEYTIEQIRDPKWVAKNGHTPSIMDYSRFNYVAQPEDNIPVKDLIPKIGPYDIWATKWGYAPIPGAKTPDDEKKTLDSWAREQDKTPWLRFSTADNAGSDPGDETEAVGDADAVKATELGLKNLLRVSDYLLPATTHEGESYDELKEMYNRMMGQWATELTHVTQVVGGFDSQEKHGGQAGVRFELVPKERQAEAVKFLNDNAFTTPKWAINTEILRRIEPVGTLDRIATDQQRILNSLMNNNRLKRLIEQAAIDGPKAYQPTQFFADVRNGIWKELISGPVVIDPYRRNLQRNYVELLGDKLNGSGNQAVDDDARALIRGELEAISQMITAALPRATDKTTHLHLDDMKDQIAKELDPKFATPAAAPGQGPGGGAGRRRNVDVDRNWEYYF